MISFSADEAILITGASSGIGAACAKLLNSLGATVIGAGRDRSRLEATRAACSEPGRFVPVEKDLTVDMENIPAWLKSLREKHGRLRGLLCCAGICEANPVRAQQCAGMRRIFDINVFAMYQIARGFLDRRNNAGSGASIVLLASTGAMFDNAGLSAYAASKGAVIAMTRSLACEMLPQQIRVNSISPSVVITPMTTNNDRTDTPRTSPFGHGQPEDVANAAAFLLSSASRWITGQNIVLDGGRELL